MPHGKVLRSVITFSDSTLDLKIPGLQGILHRNEIQQLVASNVTAHTVGVRLKREDRRHADPEDYVSQISTILSTSQPGRRSMQNAKSHFPPWARSFALDPSRFQSITLHCAKSHYLINIFAKYADDSYRRSRSLPPDLYGVLRISGSDASVSGSASETIEIQQFIK